MNRNITISLTEEQVKYLREEHKRLGCTISGIMQVSLDMFRLRDQPVTREMQRHVPVVPLPIVTPSAPAPEPEYCGYVEPEWTQDMHDHCNREDARDKYDDNGGPAVFGPFDMWYAAQQALGTLK